MSPRAQALIILQWTLAITEAVLGGCAQVLGIASRLRQFVAGFNALSVFAAAFVVVILTIGDVGTGWDLVQPVLWVPYGVAFALATWG